MTTATITCHEARFAIGTRVRKKHGASWHGRVCGYYSITLTPIGVAVVSEREHNSVQVYPEAALELMPPELWMEKQQ